MIVRANFWSALSNRVTQTSRWTSISYLRYWT